MKTEYNITRALSRFTLQITSECLVDREIIRKQACVIYNL